MSLELTKQKIDEVNALRAQARVWRIGAIIATVAVTAVFLLALRTATLRLFQPGPTRDEFVTQFQSGLKREVLPQVKTLGSQTVEQLVPRVRTELVKIQGRAPEVAEAATVQLELLKQNLPARAEKVLRASFGEMLREREAKVRELYPELTEENVAVMTNLLMAESERRAANVAQVVMTPYQETVERLAADIVAIQQAEPIRADIAPAWELAELCIGLLHSELQRHSPPEYRQFLTAAFQEVRHERE